MKILISILAIMFLFLNMSVANAECTYYNDLEIEGNYLVSNIVWHTGGAHTGWGYTDGYLVYDIEYQSVPTLIEIQTPISVIISSVYHFPTPYQVYSGQFLPRSKSDICLFPVHISHSLPDPISIAN